MPSGMANFDMAHSVLAGYEGGYSNHPADRGGETYKGIARKFHPSWIGWDLVDAAKASASFPRNLADNKQLAQYVVDFYKAEFWNRFSLDDMPQALATEIYEQAVNRGGVVRDLQKACNALNYDKSKGRAFFNDLVIDGRFGGKTLSAVLALCANGDELHLVKLLNTAQGAHYMDEAASNVSQRQFMRGWLKRVDL